MTTRDRLLDAAMSAVAQRGVGATSLADVAAEVGVTKQAVLYHFVSKDELLLGVVDAAVDLIDSELRSVPLPVERGWPAVAALVRQTFAIAASRPEVLALLREAARQGPPVSTRLAERLGPLIEAAVVALERDMDDGLLRRRDTRVLLLSFHALVVGVAVDTEVMRAAGVAPSVRSLARARRELLSLLEDALRP